jgi:hypothetical protein
MTKTTTELADAVLRELGVVDAEETPDTTDRTYVTDAYALKYAELAAPGGESTYWPAAAIPDAVFITLRDLLMNEVCGAFGDPVTPETKRQREQIILAQLKRHTSRSASNTKIPVEYF